MKNRWTKLIGVSLWSAVQILGQNAALTQDTAAHLNARPFASTAPIKDAINYILGAEDQVTIRVLAADDISDKPTQINSDGFITVPMIGRVHAGGLTVAQLEAELVKQFSKFFKNPQVTVFVSDYRSQPVSVVGAVNSAGVVQLRGKRTLMEVISLAGGLRPDAGNAVTITREVSRGRIPLPSAYTDSTGKFSIVQLNLRQITEAKDPAQNIVIEPNDVITVPRAQMVYVIGEVGKPGGFVLNDRETLSVLQALSLAGGPTKVAAASRARVLRSESGKRDRMEIATNVQKILNGQAPDVQLHADDILFIPNNMSKSASIRALETAINIGTGLAIWGPK
jgi:polysaccharide export outer membrane protein